MQMSRFLFFPHDALRTVSNTAWSFQVCFNLLPRAFPMEIKNSIILGKSPGDEVDEDRRAGELYVTIVYIRY